jgi:hypothetical protein
MLLYLYHTTLEEMNKTAAKKEHVIQSNNTVKLKCNDQLAKKNTQQK